VLRFWNNEVLENAEGVRAAIADALLQGGPPTRPLTPTRNEPVTPTLALPHQGGGDQRKGGPEATTAAASSAAGSRPLASASARVT
jgi:hypothetical protein